MAGTDRTGRPETEVVAPTARVVPVAVHSGGIVLVEVPPTTPQDAHFTSAFLSILRVAVFVQTPFPNISAQVQQAVGRMPVGVYPHAQIGPDAFFGGFDLVYSGCESVGGVRRLQTAPTDVSSAPSRLCVK